jgi:hypothetical protein
MYEKVVVIFCLRDIESTAEFPAVKERHIDLRNMVGVDQLRLLKYARMPAT